MCVFAHMQEYIIDDNLGVRKGDFLRRAIHYDGITSSDIMLLDALFFRAVSAKLLA